MERSELEAFNWAVNLIKEQQWRDVVVEGDAQNIVHALQGKIRRGFHTQIIVENVSVAASDIQHIQFNFCFSEANNIAHRLAKWASSNVCSNVWYDGCPSWIIDIVFLDLAN